MEEEIKKLTKDIEQLIGARDLIKRNLENYRNKNNMVKKQLKLSLKDINKRILEKKNILFDKLYSKQKKVSENSNLSPIPEKPGIRIIPIEETYGFKKKFEDKISELELKLMFEMENGKDKK